MSKYSDELKMQIILEHRYKHLGAHTLCYQPFSFNSASLFYFFY